MTKYSTFTFECESIIFKKGFLIDGHRIGESDKR